ncbi:T9SS type A sorting domain-containing protein [Rasiella rasia]|uniref:T9SS type A sorting domain-containing protein n=1 Tax=Rasiella rasia TaxID=2744027 RepID=A0A6G6GPS2_9FLAO|nr:T9SS type A sorting domain-containing protein [Rasiella rasia]QIE60549.1 T9SS type A sorting domain-containing protein [Rasiella rasia]
MKKIYILAAFVAFAFSANAQIDFEDNFDFYNLGDLDAQSPQWRSWSGIPSSGDDAEVVDSQALSGTQSLLIPGNEASDMVLLTPLQPTDGEYTIQFWARIAAGKSAYFNMQADLTPEGTAWNQALMGGNVYFNCDGASGGVGSVAGVIDCSASNFTFAYPEDEWFKVTCVYDLDGEEWAMSINDTEQFSGAPFEFGTQLFVQLAGLNFFSASANNEMFIDDVVMGRDINLNTDEFSTANFSMFPNPVRDVLNIHSKYNVEAITVYDVLGKEVISANPGVANATIDMSKLSSGAYLVNVRINGASKTVKVVK